MIKDRLESRGKRLVIPRKQVIISSHQISGSRVSTRQEKHDFLDSAEKIEHEIHYLMTNKIFDLSFSNKFRNFNDINDTNSA